MKPSPPYIKATKDGAIYADTSHPEYKKWFIETVNKLKGRIKIKK